MRYETRRRLETIARTLAELGEADNARALSLRLRAGSAVAWLRGGDTYGEHVWAEIGAVASFAARYRNHLPAALSVAAVALERAYGEADALLAPPPPRRGPRRRPPHGRPQRRRPRPPSPSLHPSEGRVSPRVDALEAPPQIPPVAHRMVRVSVDGHELTFVCIQDAVSHLARLWSQEISDLRASEVSP